MFGRKRAQRMSEIAEELLLIDTRLRFALFGLECALGVSFLGAECERVFRDADEDHVSAKRYTFFASSRLRVTGKVDEYEPESVCVRVEGGRGVGALLRRIADGAKFQAVRLGESQEQQRWAEPGPASDTAG